jgi:hypothetical protein
MAKVTFDGPNKLIIVNNGETSLDVAIDLYSDWKEWMVLVDNAKYPIAMRTVGGDPTSGGKSVAPYFFLSNGWKIRPYEGSHTLTLDGNLFTDEPGIYGYNLFVSTLGSYAVLTAVNLTSDAVGITTEGGTAPTADEVAVAVCNKLLSAHTIPGSMAKAISDIETDVAYIRENGVGGSGGMPSDVIEIIRRFKRVLLVP